jgi:hypothetical protein
VALSTTEAEYMVVVGEGIHFEEYCRFIDKVGELREVLLV